MYEKWLGAASERYGYIQSLPHSYSCFPYWRWHDVRLLQDERLQHRAAKAVRDMRSAYVHVRRLAALAEGSSCALPMPLAAVAYRDFVWAMCTIDTRACYFADKHSGKETGEEPGALVPLLDMFNHTHGDVARAYFDGSAYCVRTKRSYEPGAVRAWPQCCCELTPLQASRCSFTTARMATRSCCSRGAFVTLTTPTHTCASTPWQRCRLRLWLWASLSTGQR